MRKSRKIREPLEGQISIDAIREKESHGWRLVALEWEKPEAAGARDSVREEPPFGTRIATDCAHLERDPQEEQTLQRILDLIVADRSLSEIASDLNERQLPNRRGHPWRQLDVFNLWPRLIDVAPELRPVGR